MLSVALLPLVASALVRAVLVVQALLGVGHHRWTLDESRLVLDAHDLAEWRLDRLPNPNDTGHLVFETVHSLLQHWPNTRMRNGHNIVPGVIPTGTVLYHGTDDYYALPQRPDWVAADPEHAHLFCLDRITWRLQQKCRIYSLAATRPLKVVYFDGNSAANTLEDGPLDTQDLLVWGDLAAGYHSEWERVEALCKWGKRFGVDGFVRMEMDFEIMLCDFTSGLSVVSSASLRSRGGYRPGKAGFITFEVMEAGSWHNRLPGETRIQLDLAGLVSFYDTQLVPSLVAVRANQERWDHRVRGISSDDLSAVKSRLEAILVRPGGLSSGVDWRTCVQVIVDRFAGRLELLRHLLNSTATGPNELVDLAYKTQTQLRVMLTPYLLFSVTPTDPSNESLDWTIPIYKHCATVHTQFMTSLSDSMTDSERLLLQAVRGTSREICRVVTKMWAVGVHAGVDSSLNAKESLDMDEVTHVWDTWAEDLNRLMAWLDWSVWVKCRPECDPEELCYLPTWPIGFPGIETLLGSPPSDRDGERPTRPAKFDLRNMARERIAKEMWEAIRPEPGEWIRPQPKCIKRIASREF